MMSNIIDKLFKARETELIEEFLGDLKWIRDNYDGLIPYPLSSNIANKIEKWEQRLK